MGLWQFPIAERVDSAQRSQRGRRPQQQRRQRRRDQRGVQRSVQRQQAVPAGALLGVRRRRQRRRPISLDGGRAPAKFPGSVGRR